MTDLDVVIINWDSTPETLSCLESFRSWSHPPKKIWVVDNASADRGVTVLAERYPSVTVINSSVNRGFAGGNNLAIRRILEGGEEGFTLLMNNDAVLEEIDAALLIAALASDQRLGLIGPILENRRGSSQSRVGGGRDISRYLDSHVYLPAGSAVPAAEDPLHFVDYLPGTVALIRNRLFPRIGLFDEDYFFGGEMADFCERAKQAGFQAAVHYQASATHHLERSSAIRDNLHVYYIIRNRFLFVRKFRQEKRGRLLAFWSGAGLFLAGAALLRGRIRRCRAIGLALWDAWTARYGNQNRRILPESGLS